MQAAILNIKLPLLDNYIDARRKAADFYDKAFAGMIKFTLLIVQIIAKHVFHQYTLILENVESRDGLSSIFEQKIIFHHMIYYPVPAHRQKMFASFGGADYDLEKTDWLTDRVISLPIHTELG